VADFTGTPLAGCAPLEVAFVDESVGEIVNWEWDFGDGGTATASNATHTFTGAGTFTVSLTVTGPGGSHTRTRTDYVTVEEPVVAAFSQSETTGLAPLLVEFTDESAGDATFWFWDFGDASTDTVQNPTHTYTSEGDFSVTLVTGNSCSQDTLTLVDAVSVTGISGVDGTVPTRYVLEQNVPNPFNPMTTICFELPEPASVRLQIFDISGRHVRTLLPGDAFGAGRQAVVWNGTKDNGRQVSTGVYFYHLSAGPFSQTKRMTLMK
jgi:PKD repeat protein